jgi:NAD(P)-dependent dehydrogenase (short-subunit alcohol dehydrogenase family)
VLLLTLCAVARHLGWAAMRQLISLGHDVIGCSRGDVDLRHDLAVSALASHLPPSDKAVYVCYALGPEAPRYRKSFGHGCPLITADAER